MNPQTPGQQPMQSFTDAHNAIYNGLRDTLQKYVAAGVPGMDKVTDALNKQHQQGMMNYQPAPIKPVAATQTPQQAPNISQVQRQQAGNLNNLMTQIRQKNTLSLPNGYSSYA